MYVQDVVYDLEDLDKWEPVLVGATCKKHLKDKVLKRKENRFLGKLNSKQKVGVFFWSHVSESVKQKGHVRSAQSSTDVNV